MRNTVGSLLALPLLSTVVCFVGASRPAVSHAADKGDAQNGKPTLDGTYAIICKKGGKCLDAHAPDVEKNGGKVHGWQYLGRANQQWEIKAVIGRSGQFEIMSCASGKLLTNGDPIRLHDELDKPSQRWKIHKQPDDSYVIQSGEYKDALLEMKPEETSENGGTIQWFNTRKAESENQRWLLLKCEPTSRASRKPNPLGAVLETVAPVNGEREDGEVRIVWMDPERAERKGLDLLDVVRFEYPNSGREIPWSNELGRGGLDTFALPRLDLVYHVYRDGKKGSSPRFVREIPVYEKNAQAFWRPRKDNMMSVPLFFVGVPSRDGKKVTLDAAHKNLAVSFLNSPYDRGLVLSSEESLIFIRMRLAWKQDWLAVDLHLFNVSGPPIASPPGVAVRVDGGEQLDELSVEHADKLIPDNLVIGEYSGPTTHHAGGHTQLDFKPLGIGIGVGTSYSYAYETKPGEIRLEGKVHPLRRELFANAWRHTQLEAGSFRRGLWLFKLPKSKPVTDASGATIVLRNAYHEAFAHLNYGGKPADRVEVPGSALVEVRYRHSAYKQPAK